MPFVIAILLIIGLFSVYPVAMTVITISAIVLLGIVAFAGTEKVGEKVSVVVAAGIFGCLAFGLGKWGADAKNDADSRARTSSTYSTYGTSYSSSSSSRGTCIKSGCNRSKAYGSSYCYTHKSSSGSSSGGSSSSHGSSSSYSGHSSSGSSNSHNNHSSSSSSHWYPSNDPDDYDSPEDYADDAWGDDFDDWDDAYDYWENY